MEDGYEIEIEYYTEAPYSEEIVLTTTIKINVVGSEEVHYENILTFSNLTTNKEGGKSKKHHQKMK